MSQQKLIGIGKTIIGRYGSAEFPTEIYVFKMTNEDACWYAARGSVLINKTLGTLNDGVNLEWVEDLDVISCQSAVQSLEQLEQHVLDVITEEGGDR